ATLRAERSSISESRPVTAIAAEIQQAQPLVPANIWRSSNRCEDVTAAASGEACRPVLQLRQALATAQRRDAIDAELRDAEGRIAHVPAITSADPQAGAAARLLTWISAGYLAPTVTDIATARIALIAAFPLGAGLILMFAVALWQPRRER